MLDPTLPALVSLVSAYLLDKSDEKPAWPPEHGELSDARLWDLIESGGDVLCGMMFDQAVVQDPRRVDALIQQRVTREFFAALEQGSGQGRSDMLRHAYVLRNEALRQGGQISADAIADSLEQTWNQYGKLLDVTWAMKQPEAQRVREAILRNAEPIRRAFTEASDMARRASSAATTTTDELAWARAFATLHAMWESVEGRVLSAGISLPAIEQKYAGTWADPNVSWFDSLTMAGRRGPASIALQDYRLAGGRHY